MAQLPEDRLPDSTLSFVRDGYEFISNRCRRYRSDVFQTRLVSRPVICMRGAEAARRWVMAPTANPSSPGTPSPNGSACPAT